MLIFRRYHPLKQSLRPEYLAKKVSFFFQYISEVWVYLQVYTKYFFVK